MALKKTLFTNTIAFLVLLLFTWILLPKITSGKLIDASSALPKRFITMAVEYPGVLVPKDKNEVTMDIVFHNRGKSDENVSVWIDHKPDGINHLKFETYLKNAQGGLS